MEKKKSNILIFLLIIALIVIVVIGAHIYNLSNEKTEEKIILEGIYVYENSDVGYEFFSDGTAKYSTSTTEDKGTYITIDENAVEVVFTERTLWDDVSGETTVEKIDRVEKIEIIDEENLIVEYEVEGEKQKGNIIKHN